jgi:hypothetical protein
MARRLSTALVACLALACAGPPGTPASDRSGAWGYVHLVPRAGVRPGAAGGAYGDRRLRDAELVDYSRPGFSVVYGPGPAPGGSATLVIRDGGGEPRLAPAYAALGAGGSIRVENAAADPHVLSVPGEEWIRRIAPGETVELPVAKPGELPLFLLDVARARATVFVAPGPFAVVADSGRFEISGLAPGPGRVNVWHPRFPPAERELELPPGRTLRVDFELGVEQIQAGGEADGAR